jgi:hypothetical protein
VKAHKTVRSWTVNLSKTAGADGSQGRTLNPLRRASTDGEATRVCALKEVRQFGSNLEDPIAAAMPFRGAGFSIVVLPWFAAREL